MGSRSKAGVYYLLGEKVWRCRCPTDKNAELARPPRALVVKRRQVRANKHRRKGRRGRG